MRSLYIYGDIGDNFDETSVTFIQKSGGINSKIVVLGLGGSTWEGYFNRVFRDRWARLGVRNVTSIIPDVNYEFETNSYEELISCTGLLICGGDTRKYYNACVSNIKMKHVINSLYEKGIPIAGVSAGALISTSPCTVWGNNF